MLARLLRRFEPFAALEWTTLCSVARHARLLRLPAQRTLSPSRRRQHGSCYLVKGVVRRRDASGREEQIADQDAAARRALLIAGDGANLATTGPATLLWIDLDPVAFLLGADTAGYAVERLDAAPDDHWMHRFLGPGLVEYLSPVSLQTVFRAFTPLTLVAGDTVVLRARAGEHRDAAGIAHGILHIRAVEAHAARGEAVEVRRLRLRVAVATHRGPQVVGHDEQDVVARRIGGQRVRDEGENEEEEKRLFHDGCFHGSVVTTQVITRGDDERRT